MIIISNPSIDLSKVLLESRCSIWLDGNQSIPTGVHTKVEFNAELYDNLNEVDLVTNNRFTPIGAGYYHISAQGWLSAVGNDKQSSITIYKNGAEVARSGDDYSYNYLPGVVSQDVYLNGEGDYIEIFVHHTAGANKDLLGNGASTWLTIHRFA